MRSTWQILTSKAYSCAILRYFSVQKDVLTIGDVSCHASLHLFPSRTLYTHRFLFAYRRRHLSFFLSSPYHSDTWMPRQLTPSEID